MSEPLTDLTLGKKRRRLPITAGVVVLLLVVGALVTLFTTFANLQHFRDVGYPDSATLLRLEEFSLTGQMYPDFNRPPYLVTLYGPLCYILFGSVFNLAQIAGADPLTFVRFTVIASFCICLMAVFRISQRLYPERWMAWLSILFAISAAPLSPWTTQIRGDLPALALSLSSIYIYLTAADRRRRLLAALCAGLALLVKQTFVAAPCAILIWLLWQRQFREGLLWIAVVALIVLSGYAVAFLREPLMLRHLAAVGMLGLEFRDAFGLIGEAFFQPQAVFGFIGLFLAMRECDSHQLLFGSYCLMSWIVALSTILQVGGNSNYFWEPLLVSAVLAGPGFVGFISKVSRAPAFLKAFTAIILLYVFFPVVKTQILQTAISYGRLKTHDHARAEWNSFLAKIAGHRLLSTFPDLSIHSRIPEIPDPFLNTVLARRGQWSFAPILREIRAGKYDIVVINPDLATGVSFHRGVGIWTPDVWQALSANYAQACRLQNMEIWLPRVHSSRLLNSLAITECKFTSPEINLDTIHPSLQPKH